jgi:hypothetical protein
MLYSLRKRDWLTDFKLQNWYNKRKTVWNIKYGAFFDNKIWAYTDQWFIYNFDWKKIVGFWSPENIIQTTWDTNNPIRSSQNELGVWQEFTTPAQTTILQSALFHIRSQWTLWTEVNVFAKLYLASDKTTPLITSDTVIEWSSLTGTYTNFNFLFPAYQLDSSTQYYITIEATNTDDVNFVEVQSQSGNPYAWWEMYVRNWDEVDTVNTGFDLFFTIWISSGYHYNWIDFDPDIVNVSYLWWWTFATTVTVQSYNSTTREVTTNQTTITAWHVTKLAYISAGAVWWLRQVRQVESTAANNKFILDSNYSPAPTAWDTITFYNKRISQLWFPQLRWWSTAPASDNLIARDIEWNTMQRHFPRSRKLIPFDNRLASLSLDSSAIIFTDQVSIERFVATPPVYLGNDRAVNVSASSWYLLIFFANKTAVIRKTQFSDSINNSVTTIYTYQDILNIWIYSAQAYLSTWSELYMFGSDKIMYSVDIVNNWWDTVNAKLEPQSFVISNYLNKFNWWEVQMHYDSWVIYIVYIKETWGSEVYKYDKDYQARLPDTYSFGWDFMRILRSIWSTRFSNVWDSFVAFSWLTDLWQNIDQYIKMHWPIDNMMNLWVLDQVKFRIGFDWLWIGWKIRICTWWTKRTCKNYDLQSIKIIEEINSEVDFDGTMWSSMLWQHMLWWDLEDQLKILLEKYSEYQDISVNTAWFWEWGCYTYEVRNKTTRQLILSWVQPIMNAASLSDKYNKTVLASGTERSFN